MAKSSRLLLIVLIAITLLALYAVSARNGFVALEESVNTQWAQVENVYQRRADLIPNLVKTVQGYAQHEKATLEGVVKARAAAVNPQILPAQAPRTAEELKTFENAQNSLTGALSKLLVISERYPELKADQGFLNLQSQLEGTENRITVERQRYNEAVQIFNTRLRSFPANVIAGLFGFERRALFSAQSGAETVPEVKF